MGNVTAKQPNGQEPMGPNAELAGGLEPSAAIIAVQGICESGGHYGCLGERKVAEEVLKDSKLLELLVKHFQKEHSKQLKFKEYEQVAIRLADFLGTERPSQDDTFYAFLVADASGTNSLSEEEETFAVKQQLHCFVKGVPFGKTFHDSSQEHMNAKFTCLASAGQVKLTVITLAGISTPVQIEDIATGAHLKAELQIMCGIPVRQQRLVFQGVLLVDSEALHEMGVFDGANVFLMRCNPPPNIVRLKRVEQEGGQCCFECVCHDYHVTEQQKDGRCVYKAHGGLGDLYMYYQEVQKRWAIADQGAWGGYGDNSWGYCKTEAQCLSELIGIPWKVCDSTFKNYVQSPCALEIVEE